jgi:Ca2+-binding RTX toxin-like protein
VDTSRILATAALTIGSLVALGQSAVAAGPCADPTIQGTGKGETLRGTTGPDVITGGGGDDTLVGLGGDDVLCGGAGQDTLRGGPGDDTLDGGTDAKVAEDTDYYLYYGDTLDGGPGNDLLVPGRDRRHPGSVDEVTVAHATDGVTADLGVGTVVSKNDEEPQTDTIEGLVGVFTGTAYADTIQGSDQPESIYGGAGSDWVHGGGGDDWADASDLYHETPDPASNTVLGGAGDDTVNGDAGDDLLRGGPGNDLIQAGAGADRSYAGSGNDGINDQIEPVPGQVMAAGPGRHDYLASMDFYDARGRYQRHVVGRIDMTGGTARAHFGHHTVVVALPDFEDVSSPAGDLWTILGTDGPDEISAGFLDTAVRLYARGGNDRVFGSDQDDVIDGGPGHDVGNGWGGHDRIVSVERIFGR